MPITAECDDCGYSFNAPDKFAGKLVRCPECSETVRVGKPKAPRSGAARKPGRAAEKGTRSTRPSGAARPARQSGRKQSAGSGYSKTVMIAGGATIAALLGIIGFMATRGGDQPDKSNSEQTPVTTAPVDVSKDLRQAALDEETRELERKKRLAAPAAAAKVASSKGRFSLPPQGGGSSRQRPPAGLSGAPSTSLSTVTGDRVAWLSSNGLGFAKKEDMWVFNGQPSLLGIPAPGRSVQLSFYETLRTDSLIELFNTEHLLRVRLTKSGESKAYYLPKNSQTTLRDGTLLDTTASANSWLATASLPANRMRETAPDLSDVPSLIQAVKKQVARIDVSTVEGSGNGSGFLADASGRIVTNYHVIEGCLKATAVFKDAGPNGGEVEVPILGFLHVDPKRDIAILQGVLPKDFKFRGLPLADKTQQGEQVIAFGAPLGLDSSTSDGTISGYRTAKELQENLGVDGFQGNWIQTTAPISPGNSGGPLVNRSGEVVAINTMTLTSGQQLNFAISADDIRTAIDISKPTPRKLTPKALPVAAHRASKGVPGPGGRPRRSGKRIRITDGRYFVDLWPIEDTPEAAKYLAELDELILNVVPTEQVVKSGVEDAAKKAVRDAGMKVVIDEGPSLLIVPELQRKSDTAFQLQLFAHLYIVRNGEALRIWRGSEDLGRISKALLKRGSLGSTIKGKLATFFGDLTKKVSNAKKSVDSDATKPDKKDDPFSGR